MPSASRFVPSVPRPVAPNVKNAFESQLFTQGFAAEPDKCMNTDNKLLYLSAIGNTRQEYVKKKACPLPVRRRNKSLDLRRAGNHFTDPPQGAAKAAGQPPLKGKEQGAAWAQGERRMADAERAFWGCCRAPRFRRFPHQGCAIVKRFQAFERHCLRRHGRFSRDGKKGKNRLFPCGLRGEPRRNAISRICPDSPEQTRRRR